MCVCMDFKISPAVKLPVKFPVLDSSSQMPLELSHFFSPFNGTVVPSEVILSFSSW